MQVNSFRLDDCKFARGEISWDPDPNHSTKDAESMVYTQTHPKNKNNGANRLKLYSPHQHKLPYTAASRKN